jgi:hypothetical protein
MYNIIEDELFFSLLIRGSEDDLTEQKEEEIKTMSGLRAW